MLEFHAFAELFPMMEPGAFDSLVDDMRRNGFRAGKEIVLLEGKILDGRNRYLAHLKAWPDRPFPDKRFRNFSPAAGHFSTQEIDRGALAFVLAENLNRRHLDESQRAIVAAKIANLPAHRPSAQENKSANLPTSQDKAAEALNISPRLVRDAKVVLEQGVLELRQLVERGRMAVSAAARAAKLIDERQREIVKEAEAGHANVVRNVLKREARDARELELGKKMAALPDKKYGVILADPEWEFVTYSAAGLDRSASNHYPTSDEQTINQRDVQKIAGQNCLLALWVTDLARGLRTVEAWGFEYKSYFVWVKDIVELPIDARSDHRRTFEEIGSAGTGYWNRDRDELCLIGTRGTVPAPAMGTQGESVFFAARPLGGKHSAKPSYMHEWLERHYPTLPKIELNAREARPGWDVWGFEAPEEK